VPRHSMEMRDFFRSTCASRRGTGRLSISPHANEFPPSATPSMPSTGVRPGLKARQAQLDLRGLPADPDPKAPRDPQACPGPRVRKVSQVRQAPKARQVQPGVPDPRVLRVPPARKVRRASLVRRAWLALRELKDRPGLKDQRGLHHSRLSPTMQLSPRVISVWVQLHPSTPCTFKLPRPAPGMSTHRPPQDHRSGCSGDRIVQAVLALSVTPDLRAGRRSDSKARQKAPQAAAYSAGHPRAAATPTAFGV